MTTLDEIRNKLKAQNSRSENRGTGGGDKASYAFWNTPEGQTSTVRFLPDGDTSNSYFWVERAVIRLPFQGIKGRDDKEVTIQVPCMDMYGEACPILAETRPWWKDESLKPLAQKYWKKKSYLFQGFVVNSAFTEEQVPENPIRRFVINSSIFEIIKDSLLDPEMEDMPVDYTNGCDFKITKTIKGQYANYTTSSWSRKTRALSEEETAAVDTNGLFNLKDFLPKKPGDEELNAIKEMFSASVNDEAYDLERWGNFFRPYGVDMDSNSDSKSTHSASSKPATKSDNSAASSNIMDRLKSKTTEAAASNDTVASEDDSSAKAGEKMDTSDILAKIRARQKSA